MDLDKKIDFRIGEDIKKLVIDQTREHSDIYESPSHFVRVAIMRELNRPKD